VPRLLHYISVCSFITPLVLDCVNTLASCQKIKRQRGATTTTPPLSRSPAHSLLAIRPHEVALLRGRAKT
jgi:hypothetical protein